MMHSDSSRHHDPVPALDFRRRRLVQMVGAAALCICMVRAAAGRLAAAKGVREGRGVAVAAAARRLALVAGLVLSSAARQLHEAVEDGELELQLDAVGERLVRDLVVVEVRKLESHNRDVENHHQDVDEDEVLQHATTRSFVSKAAAHPQQLDGLVDVEARQHHLLQEEDDDLDALGNLIRLFEYLRVVRKRSVYQRDDHAVADDGVENDDPEDDPQASPVPQHQMQARPQHQRLTRHHEHPSHQAERAREVAQRLRPEILDAESHAGQGDANCRHQERPKVEPGISFEGAPDDTKQLENIIQG